MGKEVEVQASVLSTFHTGRFFLMDFLPDRSTQYHTIFLVGILGHLDDRVGARVASHAASKAHSQETSIKQGPQLSVSWITSVIGGSNMVPCPCSVK